MPRSEEDVLARILPVLVGGEPRELPVRAVGSAREWKKLLARSLVGGVGSIDVRNLADGGDLAAAFGDRILELVLAYDEKAALGGREYLEATATDGEVYSMFRRILEVSFPFVNDLRTAIAELRALGLADLLAMGAGQPEPDDEAVEASPSERSTLGHSANGDSLLVASTPS